MTLMTKLLAKYKNTPMCRFNSHKYNLVLGHDNDKILHIEFLTSNKAK